MSVVLAKPRTKPQSVRREELLRSAERLFIARGAAATSIDDIATRLWLAMTRRTERRQAAIRCTGPMRRSSVALPSG